MTNRAISLALVAAVLAMTGCAGMQPLEQSREDTKTVGLLVKSVATSLESYQKQRDAIAVSSLRNRQALEGLALQYEASTSASIAIWEVSGQPGRKLLYTRVHTEADALHAASEQRAARKREQAMELAKARTAVSANTTKLAETSAGLIKLGEPQSHKDEAAFFLKFAKDVRSEIQKDSEAAAADATAKSTTATSAKGDN